MDFSVLREGKEASKQIHILENAIKEKKLVMFDYINAENIVSHREIEPIVLTYKWYKWYLFGFCIAREDYRLFKLIRMNNINVTNTPFSKVHLSADILMMQNEKEDKRKYFDIKLLCKAEIKMFTAEYLNGVIEKEYADGDFILNLHMPYGEHLWFGTLLSLGNKAVVLEPEALKEKLYKKAKEILDIYQ